MYIYIGKLQNISAWLSHELIKFKLRVKTIVVVVIVRGTYTDRGTERRKKNTWRI